MTDGFVDNSKGRSSSMCAVVKLADKHIEDDEECLRCIYFDNCQRINLTKRSYRDKMPETIKSQRHLMNELRKQKRELNRERKMEKKSRKIKNRDGVC